MGDVIFARAKKKALTVGVALLDIDFFKKVNDNYGHDAGDIVLRQLGSLLIEDFEGEVASKDVVARFGGEEFCFLLVADNQKQIEIRLSALRQRIENDCFILNDGFELKVTASIGLFTGEARDLESA